MTTARDELVARVSANLDAVRERVEATGRDAGAVTIVAVTKSFGPPAAIAAYEAGLTELAENYADELVASHDALGDAPARWHFLGALQRNKLARLVPRVAVYESVTSLRDVHVLGARVATASCFVQVDVTGEPGRAGCRPELAGVVVAAARDAGLVVEGLMCVASRDPGLAAGQFAGLRRLADNLGLTGCSMGMSGDYEAACRSGATVLRLGTALFGDRPRRPSSHVA
ncbi:MAG TPA: YggS family pyridoxal phosphate enzyme [Acidimicrobiales bacterium]|nr:YggS family pyridoxal phosphate enzyme [Acidimicrobiales bacterium]